MQTRTDRWRNVQWLVILLGVLLVGELLYFASIQNTQPPRIQDQPEGLSIEFTVNKSAVLALESCVSGRWSVQGADEIRINGGEWDNEATGNYTLCNQPDLSPTLEVRLPSSAIAFYKLDVNVIFANGIHVLGLFLLVCLALWIWGVQLWSHRRLIVLVVGVHLAVVLTYSLTIDLKITNSWEWDSLIHTLDMADLRHNVLESFIYLHAQPPLFTAYGVLLDIVFGGYRAEAMYIVQVLFGLLMCVMSYGILWHYTHDKTVTLFTSFTLALNPALFFFEALILYTILAAFLVLMAGYCLLRYRQTTHNRYLYLFIFCINLLILTRSVYHIAFLIPTLLLVLILVQQNIRRVIAGCLLICLLSVGWYGKNLLVFDSFASSSWLGMSLWKVAHHDYEDGELRDLLDKGVLTDRLVLWFDPFMLPSAYPGFDPVETNVHILSEDDLNNAIYPELNQIYQDNALRLIRHDIGRYLKGALRAYGHYTCPSSTYELMEENLDAFPASHQAVSVELFHMQGLMLEIVRRLGLSQDEYGVCSNLYIALPLVMLGYPLYLLSVCRLHLRRWHEWIRRDSVLIYTWGMVTYTTVVTSLLEIPENARFKFMIEVPLFIFFTVIGYRMIVALIRRHEADQ